MPASTRRVPYFRMLCETLPYPAVREYCPTLSSKSSTVYDPLILCINIEIWSFLSYAHMHTRKHLGVLLESHCQQMNLGRADMIIRLSRV